MISKRRRRVKCLDQSENCRGERVSEEICEVDSMSSNPLLQVSGGLVETISQLLMLPDWQPFPSYYCYLTGNRFLVTSVTVSLL